MFTSHIEPLENRIAPATVLTSSVPTTESTVVSGTYDAGVDGTIELFAQTVGGIAVSVATKSVAAVDGAAFSILAPAMPVGTSFFAAFTPQGGSAEANSEVIGSTRGLWVDDVEISEGATTQQATFTVHLSLPSAAPVTVQYATSSGTATSGSDFVEATGTVTFAPGETAKTIPVFIQGDSLKEGESEQFFMTLSNASGSLIADATATGTIYNDDSSNSGTLGVYLVPLSISENGGTALVQVHLTNPSSTVQTIGFATEDGSGALAAVEGQDYSGLTGAIQFDVGETVKTISVPILNDSAFEGTEYFSVKITSATGVMEILTPSIPIKVVNDDAGAGPSISIADVAVTEGTSSSPTSLSFTVTLSEPALEQVVLRISTGDGTAKNTDYSGGTGTLTFEIGETSGSISLPVRADNFNEANETLFFALDQVRGASVTDSFSVATILNDDSGLPVLEIADTTVSETDAAGASAAFVVTLSLPSTSAVTVNLATGQGTALAGIDYAPASGTLTFQPGETSKTIQVAIAGDLAYESNETFGLTLSAASGATIADTVGVATIFDNDPVNNATPLVRVLDGQILEGTGTNPTGTVTVFLDHAATSPVTVQLGYRSGTAVNGRDFGSSALTINIPVGADSGTSAFTVAADFAMESNEYFFADITSATGATIARKTGRVTIVNDDAGPEISEDQKTAKWRDVDGDLVALTASRGILTTANFAMVSSGGGLILGALFLDTPEFQGISVNITAKGPGNSINMGGIIASGVDLGIVKVMGDISRIIAGSSTSKTAVAKLEVSSLGSHGSSFDLEGSVFSQVTGKLGSLIVHGNVENAIFSVDSGKNISIGALKVEGSLKGGTAAGSGYIFTSGDIVTADIRRGILGGTGFYSGTIQTLGKIGKVTIGGNMQGGNGDRSGSIFVHGFHDAISAGIGSVVIKGSLIGGGGSGSGAIYSLGSIGSLAVAGSVSNAFVAAGGIGKITVARDVVGAEFVTGILVSGTGLANPTSSPLPVARATSGVGTIAVGGNWVASSVAADVAAGTDNMYGTADDRLLFPATVAAIKSVKIKGSVVGSSNAGDSYGFVARTIGSFHAANSSPALNPAGVDSLPLGSGGDVFLREITAA